MNSANFIKIFNMDQLHLHQFINYWPLVCLSGGILVLLFALIFKNHLIKIMGYVLFMIAILMTLIFYQTGKGAEDAIENILGTSNNMIEQHGGFSIYTWIAVIVLGIATVIGIFLYAKTSRWAKKLDFLILVVAIACLGLIGRTSYQEDQNMQTASETGVTFATRRYEPVHEHSQSSQVAMNVQLNNGQRWIADDAARNAITDLQELTNTINDPVLLKQSLQQRINRLFQECTMKGDADKQLHNFLIPLMDKIKQLDENSRIGDVENIQSYLETFSRYFK